MIRILAIFLFCIFASPSSAQAEVFSVNINLSEGSLNTLYRDNLIEKDLEIVYSGIAEHPDPTDINDTLKEYKFRLLMKNWLGVTLAEKIVGVFEGPLQTSDIDMSVYDPKAGKWQEFRDMVIIVRPETTGTYAQITVTGAGRLIDPMLEPFATGAQQLDNFLNLKIEAEYLPPEKSMTITSSVLKKRSSSGEVTDIGKFSFTGKTDAEGKLTVGGNVRVNEPFDDRNKDTYTVTASASYYFTFYDSAVTELRSAHTNLVKTITINDFELRNDTSEFGANRAYFTWNDKIKNISDSRLTKIEKQTGAIRISYAGSIKNYENLGSLTVSLRDLNEKTISFTANGYIFTIARDAALEVGIVPGAAVEINGIKKAENIYSAKMFVAGGAPRVALRDSSGKTVVEENGRDLRLIFEKIAVIPHQVAITDGGAVSLSFAPQAEKTVLRWRAQLESLRRPGLVKEFIIAGETKNGSAVPETTVNPAELILELQKQLIILLQKLLALLRREF
jgi:hypothetical protein